MDRLLHTANALVSLAALVTAGGPIAAAGAAVTVGLSWRAIINMPPVAPDLAAELARDMAAVLDAHHASDDQRALIPQMVEAALPDPTTIIGAALDADRLMAQMEAALTDREHRLEANLTLFRATLLPALMRLLNDPDFTKTLAPQFMRAVLDHLNEMAAILTELKDRFGSLAGALDHREELHTKDLEILAFRFNLSPAPNTPRNELLVQLETRAQEVAEMKRELESLRARFPKLDNQITAAKELLEAGETAGVRAMVRAARKVLHDAHLREGLEQDAELVEIDARALLYDGQVDEAFRVLGAAADSFKAIDPLEPSRRRIRRYFNTLYAYGLHFGGDGVKRALELIEPSLTDEMRDLDFEAWVDGKDCVATAYSQSGSAFGGELGFDCIRKALEIFDEILSLPELRTYPLILGRTHNGAGNSLARLAEIGLERKDAEQALSYAIEHHKIACDAAKMCNAIDEIAQYANSLGVALATLGMTRGWPNGKQLLIDAVAAYTEALEFRDRVNQSFEFSETQNNLCLSLCELGKNTLGSTGKEYLTRAKHAAQQALMVRVKDRYPVPHARTIENLALIEQALAQHDSCSDPAPHLRAALAHVEAALEVFDPDHMPYNHQKASTLRDDLRRALQGDAGDPG
ncbi:MAG: hypothetical protein JJU07_14540 [Natronohydrobacter sp.]|nr:hypothetical protein [Natronohydrobacter sp.]